MTEYYASRVIPIAEIDAKPGVQVTQMADSEGLAARGYTGYECSRGPFDFDVWYHTDGSFWIETFNDLTQAQVQDLADDFEVTVWSSEGVDWEYIGTGSTVPVVPRHYRRGAVDH